MIYKRNRLLKYINGNNKYLNQNWKVIYLII